MIVNRSLRKIRSKTRAIEPIIASLLLIAIAVAAAVITYSWVTGMVTNQQAQAGTSIRVDNVQFATMPKTVVLTVRNTGTATAVIATIYLTNSTDSALYTISSPATYGAGSTATIPAGSTKVFTITTAVLSWKAATSYMIKIITDNGFLVESSYTAPVS